MDVSAILDPLNDAQRQAVTAEHKPMLILAGAGSGKTRVLVHRIAWLVQVEGVNLHNIIAVTFTNKAAAEMRGRIEGMLEVPAAPLWIGTFHGLAHRLLRRHWREADLMQSFQIMDADDQKRMMKRVMREMELDEGSWPPREMCWWVNKKKEEAIRPQHMHAGEDDLEAVRIRVYQAYENMCARTGQIDFAEMLLRAHELWLNNPHLLAHYQRRFQHVLVDEFQDTNTIQYAWLRLLLGKTGTLFGGGTESVPRGAIAALGFDYFQVGYTADQKAVQILKDGKKPGDVPSSLTEQLRLVVNLKAAKAQGLDLDEKYVKMAEEVIK